MLRNGMVFVAAKPHAAPNSGAHGREKAIDFTAEV